MAKVRHLGKGKRVAVAHPGGVRPHGPAAPHAGSHRRPGKAGRHKGGRTTLVSPYQEVIADRHRGRRGAKIR